MLNQLSKQLFVYLILILFTNQFVLATPSQLPQLAYPFDNQEAYWINSKPLHNNDLRGKTVLVMFWTFGCYNCKNSIEWINAMHDEYSDQGLVILGIHTPEFDYEKIRDSVVSKVAEFNIKFPVMLDNDFVFWKDMQNQWWPSFYFVDKYGNIVAEAIGETHLNTKKSADLVAVIDKIIQ